MEKVRQLVEQLMGYFGVGESAVHAVALVSLIALFLVADTGPWLPSERPQPS